MRKIGIVIFDMDDTLLDRESVFVKAQTAMLQSLAKHDPTIDPRKDFETLREIDSELIWLHRGKHMYEYWKLSMALWLHLHEAIDKEEAARSAFRLRKTDIELDFVLEAARRHNDALENTVPKLFNDANRVLQELKKRYVLVLFPSGKKSSQMRVIKHHGFDEVFDGVFISERKNKETWSKARRLGEKIFSEKYKGNPNKIVVVGDRISQDIIPGKEIEAETVWIPGPYDPGTREEGKPDHEISDLSELLEIL